MAIAPLESELFNGPCMISETSAAGDLAISSLHIRNTVAANATPTVANTEALALRNSHYTHRVVHMAVRLVVEDGLPYRHASWHLWRDHRVFVPWSTIKNWVEATGKKSRAGH